MMMKILIMKRFAYKIITYAGKYGRWIIIKIERKEIAFMEVYLARLPVHLLYNYYSIHRLEIHSDLNSKFNNRLLIFSDISRGSAPRWCQ